MAAYVIAEIDVRDADAYKAYAEKAPGCTLGAGGKYLARGGAIETFEGEPPSSRVVIIEFESMEKARAFYTAANYQEIIPIRQGASNKGRMFVVDGVK